LFLEDVLNEYMYHCKSKGFTRATIKNKNQECKQLFEYLKVNRGITDLESVTTFDLKAYLRKKQKDGLQYY